MANVRGRVAALAQLFRFKPVASWGFSAALLGGAVAVHRVGYGINLLHGGLAIVLVALAQGFVSHALNDAYDWLTGTDKESIGKGTGGSRVIPEGKLSWGATLAVGIISLIGVLTVGAYFVDIYGTPMLILLAIAIWSPVSYSVPPLKLGYRPFNEVVVVLPALTGVVVGTDLVLTGSWSWLAIGVGATHALLCIAWFVVSRVPDYTPDKRVGKVTSVVFVGRDNAALLSAGYLALALAVGSVVAVTMTPAAWTILFGWAAQMIGLSSLDAYDPEMASATRLQNMTYTTYHALALAFGLVVSGV